MPLMTIDDIKEKAPDRRAFAAAKKVAVLASWSSIGRDNNCLWGVAVGSSGDSYSVYVEGNNTLECSCPSRKRPCKHSLALLILDANGDEIPDSPLPANHKWLAQDRYYSSWE